MGWLKQVMLMLMARIKYGVGKCFCKLAVCLRKCADWIEQKFTADDFCKQVE